jgi:hypothetical protein
MNIFLVRKLVEAGIIKENTEIEANYIGMDISGSPLAKGKGFFNLKALKVNEKIGRVIFHTVSTIDGSPKILMDHEVCKIEGMEIHQLAQVHGIDPLGGLVPVEGKRRGRKPNPVKKAKTPKVNLLPDGTEAPKRRRGRPPGSKTKKQAVAYY